MNAKIIYGTAWKKERTSGLVISAVLNGFKAIDTACQPKHYREDLVGEALQVLYDKHGFKREDILLQTKFTPLSGQLPTPTLPYDPSTPLPTQILSSFSTSLSNLKTTYLDSYLLHSPMRSLALTLQAWNVLVGLREEGKVRKIGISNCYDVRILEALEEGEEEEGVRGKRKVDVVQNRWYEGNEWDVDVWKYCVERGIQYQSFWTLSGSPSLLSHPSTLHISRTKQITPSQVIYKLAQMHGITPLSGTTKEEHMKDGVGVERIDLFGDVVEGEDVEAVARELVTSMDEDGKMRPIGNMGGRS
ncbi:hypothetical protein JAAARDRAFT_71155 [Jaapia argillacea MUCL 33604]|uniref:NADP-dependent oxidoreductase domain-containing protein n=1 Tax=Jaapia argillacea MUCL 33604 TaxID=933084 RepID=A0A067PLU7_9AGAM|nr:hypothetical protein JAAARDRAFT_71155 [Jaapia argillacea MUCL 33604]